MEAGSGKSLVALGLMELLSARVDRLGFFRPIVPSDDLDPQLELVRRRYQLAHDYDDLHALTQAEADAIDDYEELRKRVLHAYRQLAERCDFVLVEGTDFGGVAAGLAFGLNADLANELGAPVCVVVKGGLPAETIAAVHVARESLSNKGCSIFGIVVNRAPADYAAVTAERLEDEPGEPIYVLGEQPDLDRPTVGEVAAALGAQVLVEPPESLHREVRDVRVGAMSVEHFIEQLVDGALVVVPSDRADILVASLASSVHPAVPSVAGVVLTGSYPLSETMRGLLEGAPFAVLATPELTHVAAVAVQSVRPVLRGDNERKIAAALGLFEAGVDTAELERRIALPRPERITPLMFEYDLIERARADRRHIVLPEGDDDRILRAAEILLRRSVVDLTILGVQDDVRERAAALGVDLDGARLVDPVHSPRRDAFAEHYYELRKHRGMTEERAFDILADPNYFGTMLVQEGAVDGMVSGAAHTTGDTIRPAFEIIRPREGTSGRVERLLHVPARPRARLRRLRRQSEARPAAAGGHRDQLGRDGRAVRRRAPDRDALLLDGRVRVGAGRRRRSRSDRDRPGTASGSRRRGADPVRRRGRRRRRRRQAAGQPRGRAGDGARLPRPRHRERRLQGGAALLGRRGDRTGAPGPAQAGQRPQPRLHRHGHRQHRRHHRDPGAGVRHGARAGHLIRPV